MPENIPDNNSPTGDVKEAGPRQRPSYQCKHCGTAFKHRYQPKATNTFCSRACSNLSRAVQDADRPLICACGCGQALPVNRRLKYNYLPYHKTKPLTGSLCECGCGAPILARATKAARFLPGHHNRMQKRAIDIGVCAECRNPFTVKRRTAGKYCSQRCGGIALGRRSNGGQHKFISANINTQRKYVRSCRLRKCERCGYDKVPEILTIHHKDEDRSNGTPDNLEQLCWNCHMEEHFRRRTGPYRTSQIHN